MNKKSLIIIGMMIILASMVFADATNNQVGDVDRNLYISKLSFLDRMKLSLSHLGGFTVVNGGTCSVNPDLSANIYWNPIVYPLATDNCYTNNNHVGVAFQMFQTFPTSSYLGELDVPKGQTKCFDSLLPGYQYRADYYYCDATQVVNTCSDTDGGKIYDTYGSITVTMGSNSPQQFNDVCQGGVLLERYCDSYNTAQSTQYDCAAHNKVCQAGACKEGSTSTTTLSPNPTTPTTTLPVNACSIDDDCIVTSLGTSCINGQCTFSVTSTTLPPNPKPVITTCDLQKTFTNYDCLSNYVKNNVFIVGLIIIVIAGLVYAIFFYSPKKKGGRK